MLGRDNCSLLGGLHGATQNKAVGFPQSESPEKESEGRRKRDAQNITHSLFVTRSWKWRYIASAEFYSSETSQQI